MLLLVPTFSFFFFNDPPTTEIYTLSLHDALPIWAVAVSVPADAVQSDGLAITMVSDDQALQAVTLGPGGIGARLSRGGRSEEHTSELQSQSNLVCRLLLEKKKKKKSQESRRC